ATRARAGFRARVTSPCRSSSRAPASPCRRIRSELDSAIRPRSWPTAIRAPAPRSRRWRCAWRDTAHATTQARGTSGRATTTCRSKEAVGNPHVSLRHGLVSDTRPCLGWSRLDRSGDSLGSVDETRAELAAQRVPGFDPLGGFGEQRAGVDRQPLLLVDPALYLVERHLGMELHAPRAVAEPEGLCAHAVARQLDGARRHIVGVVVPLKRVEGWRQPSEDRVLRARLGQLDGEPAD